MADLVDTRGFSKKWLSQFDDDLAAAARKRAEAIESARIAGLKDRVVRLTKEDTFWKAHPEMDALRLLREQNKEQFDIDYPQHANLKEIVPMINKAFAMGNDIEISDVIARVAAPASERINYLQELDSDPAAYGPDAGKVYGALVPGGGGSLKELNQYSYHKKDINKKFSNRVAHDSAIRSQEAKYPVQKFGESKLRKLSPEEYLANKPMYDARTTRENQIKGYLAKYAPYYYSQKNWARPLGEHFEYLSNKLAEAENDPSALDDWQIDEREKAASNTILNMQQEKGKALANYIKDPKSQLVIKDAFVDVMKEQGVNSRDAENIWNERVQDMVKKTFGSEKSDLLAMGNLLEAISVTSNDRDQDRERIVSALTPHIYNLTKSFAPDLITKPHSPGGRGAPTPSRATTGEGPPGGSGGAAPAGGNPPYNDYGPETSTNTGGPNAQQEEQTPPVQADPALNMLAQEGVLATETGWYYKNPDAMPGGEGAAKKIPDEQVGPILRQIFTINGVPQYYSYARNAGEHMQIGIEPREYFGKIPAAYTKFGMKVREAYQKFTEIDKAISTAKTDAEKQAAMFEKENVEKTLQGYYKQFGTGASQVEEIGKSMIIDFIKGISLAKVFQSNNQKFKINVPQAPQMPTQQGAQPDPIAQGIGEQKLMREKIKTQEAQKDISVKDEDRAQEKQQVVEDRIEAKKERAHDQAMKEKQMVLEEKKANTEAAIDTRELGMKTQIAQDGQQMKLQQYVDNKEAKEAERQQQAQLQAQQAQLQAQQGPMQAGGDPLEQKLEQATSKADPFDEAINALHSNITPHLSPKQKIKNTQWNAQSGQNETTIIDEDGRELKHPVDEIAMEGYNMHPAHRKLLSQDPGQRQSPQQAPTEQIKVFAPGNIPPRAAPQQAAPASKRPAQKAAAPAKAPSKKGINSNYNDYNWGNKG